MYIFRIVGAISIIEGLSLFIRGLAVDADITCLDDSDFNNLARYFRGDWLRYLEGIEPAYREEILQKVL